MLGPRLALFKAIIIGMWCIEQYLTCSSLLAIKTKIPHWSQACKYPNSAAAESFSLLSNSFKSAEESECYNITTGI